MAYLGVSEVNTWLEPSKASAEEILPGIETVVSSNVIGRLAVRYDVSAWVDEATTPALPLQLMAMLYAAAHYRRAYSEDLIDGAGLNWADWLEKSVEGYLTQIIEGAIQLDDIAVDDTGLRLPAFYPTDLSSEDDPAKFTMMAEF